MSRHHRSVLLRAPRGETIAKGSAMSAHLKSKLGFWTPWATVAFLAVMAGLMLPQLMPGETVVEKPRARTEISEKTTEYTAPSLPDMPSPQALLGRLVVGTVFVLGLSVASLWGCALDAGERSCEFGAPRNALDRNIATGQSLCPASGSPRPARGVDRCGRGRRQNHRASCQFLRRRSRRDGQGVGGRYDSQSARNVA